jgi:hypothetical protein
MRESVMQPLTSFLANQTSKHRLAGRCRAGALRIAFERYIPQTSPTRFERGAAACFPTWGRGPYGLVAAVVMIVA